MMTVGTSARRSCPVPSESCCLCSAAVAMAPPPKGTKKYEAYLKAQKARRRQQRAQVKQKAIEASSRKLVAAARADERAKCEKELLAEKQRNNRKMRIINGLEHAKAEMRKHADKMEKLAATEKRKRESVVALHDAAVVLLAQKEADLQRVEAKLTGWQTWWNCVRARASSTFLDQLRKMSRPLRASSDRSWGGGQ